MGHVQGATSSACQTLLDVAASLLGINPEGVADATHLLKLGMDSLQLAGLRDLLQRAVGRPFSVEQVAALTIGDLRALSDEAGARS